jgi:CRISPR-associated protein Cas2
MIEPKAGIFLGRMTARIRDELWRKVLRKAEGGAALQAWSSPTEQGFQFRTFGDSSRQLIDFEGLHLVLKPSS